MVKPDSRATSELLGAKANGVRRSAVCWLLAMCVAGLAATASGRTPTALVAWSSTPNGTGAALAQLVPPGNTPSASADGRDMTVSWAGSTLTGGTPASGYEIRRFDTLGIEQTVFAGCDEVVTSLSCTEEAVPAGTWRYTVTPVFGPWTGTQSSQSAAEVTSSARLTIPSSTISSLPTTLSGTISGFTDGEGLTWHLDSPTGPLLEGTPATVPDGGSTSITVTIPVGVDNFAHSVFAVGDDGTLASTAITILDPPLLTSLRMFDSNLDGKIDRVTATFSKALGTYTAGTTPWTLTAVPSGGTLASVAVAGNTATLTLSQGAGPANTSPGSFTVALAANEAGVRDAAGQPATFSATAPADRAVPVLMALAMKDANGNGRIDQVTATFSEPLAAYTAGTTPWTLSNVPSNGSLSSVAVSGAIATLTLTEGAGAPDTSVGSFTVALAANSAGVADSAGNQASFTGVAPTDSALVVRLSMVMQDVNGNGKIDRVALTFSEPLAGYTAGTAPWSLANVPSAGTLSSVTVSGSTATLNLSEGAGAVNTAVGTFTVALSQNAGGIRDAVGNLSSWASTAPTDGAAPVLTTLTMSDATLNGKVDRVTATFSEALPTYAGTLTPWTLTAVPSGGTLASVAVTGTTATLTITEGAGAADTTVGSFTVALATSATGVADAAGNQASFTTTAPADKAAPARLSMVMQDVNGNGKVDRVSLTFSEPLAPYAAGTTGWTLTSAPSGATLASVAASGTTATLTLNEGAAAATTAVGSFKITLATNAGGIRDAAANLSSWASTAPTDGAAPVLTTLTMSDATLNGKVDRVTATFSEPLPTYAGTLPPWTLTAVPSGGTLSSVAVIGTTATLTITEGPGAADTTVGSFTVALATSATGVADAAGNQASFVTTAPADKAAPARLSMVMQDVNGNGKVDQVTMTFSEPLAPYTAGTTGWTLTSAPSAATLSSVTAAGSTATLNLNEGTGAVSTALGSFKITLVANAGGIRDAAANLTAFAATAPTDGAAPVLTTLTATDTNFNGKVDHVTAVFSETLTTYTAGVTPWTLTAVPSGGTLASVTVATTTATLTITEGPGPADTTVANFTVALAANPTGIRDTAGNQGSFTTTAPADKAAPARLSMVMQDVNGNGRVDQVTMTFSEPLAPHTAGTTGWTLANVPSGGTLASVAVSGSTATLTLAEGAGAQNTAVGTFTVALATNAGGIRDAAANLTAFAATAPTDGAAPVLVTLTTTDTNFNGKVDHVTAVFSETLTTYTAGVTPWTLTAVPSGGTLASVTVATTTATLTITEGPGPADTTVANFTVALATNPTGIRDTAGNLASFATTAPADKAGPAAVAISSTGGVLPGRIEAGDTLVVTFSEPLSPPSVPTTATVTETDPSGAGFDTVNIAGLTNGNISTGSDLYVLTDNTSAAFASSTIALSNNNATATITVGGVCQGTGCLALGTLPPAASFPFAPATTITDLSTNAAAGTFTLTIRLF